MKLSRYGEMENDGLVWERLEKLKKKGSINTPVNLLITQRDFGPMTWGLRNPWIALPESARRWNEERINAVLLHELAHIKRRDSVTEWLCQVACAVQWWNPLIWFVCRQLRMERESACDDAALAQGIEPSRYAEIILDIAAPGRCVLAPAMGTGFPLESRLKRILDVGTNRGSGKSWLPWALVLPLAAGVVWLTSGINAEEKVDNRSIPIADGFDFPVGKPDGSGYRIYREFSANSYTGEAWTGEGEANDDFGDPVHAIGVGVVVYSEDHTTEDKAWGNVVIIRHSYREEGELHHIESLYAVMDSRLVKEGDVVKRGQQIGTIGNLKGRYQTSAHLYFEIRKKTGMQLDRHKFPKDTTVYHSPRQFLAKHRGGSSCFTHMPQRNISRICRNFSPAETYPKNGRKCCGKSSKISNRERSSS